MQLETIFCYQTQTIHLTTLTTRAVKKMKITKPHLLNSNSNPIKNSPSILFYLHLSKKAADSMIKSHRCNLFQTTKMAANNLINLSMTILSQWTSMAQASFKMKVYKKMMTKMLLEILNSMDHLSKRKRNKLNKF